MVSSRRDVIPEPMDIPDVDASAWKEEMEESDSHSDDSDSNAGRNPPPFPIPPVGRQRGQRGGMFNPLNPAANRRFGGRGHRLGGRGGQVLPEDDNRQSQRAAMSGK